jgi:4-amino-4-deoxy-L-arabinose transferase-like glycosyltransferase
MILPALKPAAAAPGAAWLAQHFWLIAAALLGVRMLLGASCNLVPDEAFYWTWTRHLALGYFDHPPMIAWLMWISTRLLGNTELGVRFPAAVLSIGSLAVLVGIARQVLHDARAVGFVILMWIAGPLLPVIGTIITPDAPATFFSVCALACAVRISDYDDLNDHAGQDSGASAADLWLMFGLFCGLALLSKYTTVLVPAGVVLALLTSRKGRRHLGRPWIYLSGLVALAVFSPCIYWNYQHQWASFLFQINHGAGGGSNEGIHGFLPRLLSVASFIGGQAAVWTPVLFGIAVVVIFVNWGRFGKLCGVDRLLLWSGTLPLVFFGAMSLRSHGEINWPAFAYFPLSILVARYLAANWDGITVQWARAGCVVAVGFTLGVHLLAVPSVQQALLRWHFPLTHQITDLWGWPQFGQRLSKMAGGVPVVCNRHQDAGEAAFYMPGQPDVWCDGIAFRRTAFDYFDSGRPDFEHEPQVLFVADPRHVDAFMKKWHYTQKIDITNIVLRGLGKNRAHSATRLGR